MGWRVVWLQAQIAGVVFSSIVWIVVAGLSLTTAATILVAGSVVVLGRNTRPGLWWRFGARSATPFERDLVQAAIVPITWLEGGQPTIWVGRRTGDDDAIMPTRRDLVVSAGLLGRMAAGRLADDQVCAVVSSASGRQPVTGSVLVASIDAYCAPWHIVTILTSAVSDTVDRTPLLSLAWKARWIVFGMAMIDSLYAQRWPALISVALLALLGAVAPRARRRWLIALQNLGHERVPAHGFGRTQISVSRVHGEPCRTRREPTRATARVDQVLGTTEPSIDRRAR